MVFLYIHKKSNEWSLASDLIATDLLQPIVGEFVDHVTGLRALIAGEI